jgi:hypothetical protein
MSANQFAGRGSEPNVNDLISLLCAESVNQCTGHVLAFG